MKKQNLSSTDAFVSYTSKYVGVGILSGSMVHAATLSGDLTRYIILFIIGVAIFVVGNIIEYERMTFRKLLSYIGISTILSIGVGMVSGGAQHYLDNPPVAAVLFPVGLLLAYIMFMLQDFRNELNTKKIVTITIMSAVIFAALFGIAKLLPESAGHSDDDHVSAAPASSHSPQH